MNRWIIYLGHNIAMVMAGDKLAENYIENIYTDMVASMNRWIMKIIYLGQATISMVVAGDKLVGNLYRKYTINKVASMNR